MVKILFQKKELKQIQNDAKEYENIKSNQEEIAELEINPEEVSEIQIIKIVHVPDKKTKKHDGIKN